MFPSSINILDLSFPFSSITKMLDGLIVSPRTGLRELFYVFLIFLLDSSWEIPLDGQVLMIELFFGAPVRSNEEVVSIFYFPLRPPIGLLSRSWFLPVISLSFLSFFGTSSWDILGRANFSLNLLLLVLLLSRLCPLRICCYSRVS